MGRSRVVCRLKGLALKFYFDLRMAGELKQQVKGRCVRREDVVVFWANSEHKTLMKEWEAEGHLDEWNRQSFFAKLFLMKPWPRLPRNVQACSG